MNCILKALIYLIMESVYQILLLFCSQTTTFFDIWQWNHCSWENIFYYRAAENIPLNIRFQPRLIDSDFAT